MESQNATAVWSWSRRLTWVVLLVLACFFHGSFFFRALSVPGDNVADFFQEWASARNFFEGAATYTPQRETLRAYLHIEPKPNSFFIEINAHPPTAVLAALPFAWLEYREAFLVWNWLSLVAIGASIWLIVRESGLRWSPWAWLPVLTLLLGNPFMEHLAQGQLGAFLLLLITGAWVADRRGYDFAAGGLLAVATAVKLFPGFLFLYFVFKGKRRTVAAGAVAFVAVTALTAAVLGPQAFDGFFHDALPQINKYRDAFSNRSLHGYWLRLFDPQSGATAPLVHLPWLAQAGYCLSAVMVLGFLGMTTLRSRRRETDDLVFSLYLPAMILVSPITWDHYFILLTQTVVLIGSRLTRPDLLRGLFRLSLTVMWFNPYVISGLFLGANWLPVAVSRSQNLLVISLGAYATLIVFAVATAVTRSAITEPIRAERQTVFLPIREFQGECS